MPRPLTLIAGATASGKSALAMARARDTGAVIVNADSQQLYEGLRVLTARPSLEDEAAVPHDLYGVADPAEAWSVGRWLRAVEALLASDDRPMVIVGGTGLYFHALTVGLAPTPDTPVAVREQVQARYDVEGEAAFRAELARHDPMAERAISAGDRQRLVRAAAVLEATGKTITEWRAESRPLLASGSYDGLVLERDRADLYRRCDERVDAMIAGGAMGEVRDLMTRNLPTDLPAMKAVGLRELAGWLNGDTPREQAVEGAKRATRNYAKRQLTWFRNQMPDWPRVTIP